MARFKTLLVVLAVLFVWLVIYRLADVVVYGINPAPPNTGCPCIDRGLVGLLMRPHSWPSLSSPWFESLLLLGSLIAAVYVVLRAWTPSEPLERKAPPKAAAADPGSTSTAATS